MQTTKDLGQFYVPETQMGICEHCDRGQQPYLIDEDGNNCAHTGGKVGIWSHSLDYYTWPCPRLEPEEYRKAKEEYDKLTYEEKENYYG